MFPKGASPQPLTLSWFCVARKSTNTRSLAGRLRFYGYGRYLGRVFDNVDTLVSQCRRHATKDLWYSNVAQNLPTRDPKVTSGLHLTTRQEIEAAT